MTSATKADEAADAVKSVFGLQPAREGSAVVSYGGQVAKFESH